MRWEHRAASQWTPRETVYVAGSTSNNAFKITAAGVVTQIIDASGDGIGHTLFDPLSIGVRQRRQRLRFGGAQRERLQDHTTGGVIAQILDSAGDGMHPIDFVSDVFVDGDDTLYVLQPISAC